MKNKLVKSTGIGILVSLAVVFGLILAAVIGGSTQAPPMAMLGIILVAGVLCTFAARHVLRCRASAGVVGSQLYPSAHYLSGE